MSLTDDSGAIFKCTFEQAQFVADCAGLKYKVCSDYSRADWEKGIHCYGDVYDLWEDKQTSGGGARVCWARGVVWVTRHSGYPQADIVEEVCNIFKEIGCIPCKRGMTMYNPQIYGSDKWNRNPETWEKEIPVDWL